MSDIYFDSSADAIVDDWIKDVDTNPFAEKSVRIAGMPGDLRNNFGIGFDSKGKGGLKDESNALIESIKKKKAKTKLSNKDIHYELHGVVDEGEELSRTSMVTNKKVTKGIQKAKVSPSASLTTNKPDVPLAIEGVVKAGDAEKHSDAPTKRPKTRSKQKNIRRDKRAQEHKPNHLQIGTKDYRGRPITAVCYLAELQKDLIYTIFVLRKLSEFWE